MKPKLYYAYVGTMIYTYVYLRRVKPLSLIYPIRSSNTISWENEIIPSDYRATVLSSFSLIIRIMSLRFVDRQRELELLKDFASQKRAGIAVVYGRRVSLYVGIGRYISLYLSYA